MATVKASEPEVTSPLIMAEFIVTAVAAKVCWVAAGTDLGCSTVLSRVTSMRSPLVALLTALFSSARVPTLWVALHAGATPKAPATTKAAPNRQPHPPKAPRAPLSRDPIVIL